MGFFVALGPFSCAGSFCFDVVVVVVVAVVSSSSALSLSHYCYFCHPSSVT